MDWSFLSTITLPLSESLERALRNEVESLIEAAEDDVEPATALGFVTASLRRAGLGEAEAKGCAELLVDACFPGNADIADDIFAAIRQKAQEGTMSLSAGDVKFLASRFARLAGIHRDQAKVAIALLAVAVGLALSDSAVATHLSSTSLSSPASSVNSGYETVGLSNNPEDSTVQLSRNNLQVSRNTPSGLDLQQALLDAPLGSEVRLPAGEFEGPFVIERSLTIIGQGPATTLWAKSGPVVQITFPGVTLRRLAIEVTGDSEDVALLATDGAAPELDEVRVRGRIEGDTRIPGKWNLP